MDVLKALRGTRRGMRAVIAGVSIVGAVAVYAIVSSGGVLLIGSKTTPQSLTVYSSASLPPEVQDEEAATAPYLFDRDTTTEHVVYDVSEVEAAFETAHEMRAVKIYGAAPYRLTVKADSGGSYQAVAGLEDLDLSLLPAGWHAFSADVPVTTAKLMFVLTPQSGGSASGLRELEVWTTAAPVNTADGAALVEKMLGPEPLAQGRVYTALNPTDNPTEGVIEPSGDDEEDNTFSFSLDRDPAHFVRAYLTYELFGQEHWVSPLRRINQDMSNAGGALLLPADEWSLQVERINPAWLQEGANTIEFDVLSSSFKEAGYRVRDVRVVGELDTGANGIEAIRANQPDAVDTNPVEALYDGDVAAGWQPYPADQPINADAPSVELDLRRPTQMDSVSLYLAGSLDGELKISVKRDGLWSDFAHESAEAFASGWNTIEVDPAMALEQRIVEAVRLDFLNGASSNAAIGEFAFSGSAVGTRTGPPAFHVTYPDAEQFYGRRAFVQGFLEPWDNGSGTASITLGGRTVLHVAGTVSNSITKDDLGLTDQADNDAWSVELEAVYPDGETVSTLVSLTEQRDQAAAETGTIADSFSDTVKTKGKKTIAHDESELVFTSGTVETDTEITVTPLAPGRVPALDVGMVNVTKGPRRGYRFLPHGAKFLKKIDVTLPYNKALIPPGHTEADVRTFYFDEEAGRWIALEHVGVDTSDKVVNSLTDHFTDMINAVVTVPDHPEAVSFNPTRMKDIKAADPGAKVNLIEAPQVNNMGDARLTYPIEVPPGRQGLQPQLAVQYNSAGGNGWLGMGWDLQVDSITIDTRYGVPRYDSGLETETYLFNGEQLTPVAHRGELEPRNTTGGKVFHTRVEGQFRQIVRHGTSPSTYWWEVTDKNGIRYFCGGDPVNGRLASATLADDSGNIFKWAVTEVRDLNGNTIRYRYDKVSDPGVAGGTVAGRELYLRNINYTGRDGAAGAYDVTFHRDSQLPEYVRRPDVTIDARGGFKRVTAELLKQIDVTFNNELVRRYELVYNDNPYGDGRPALAFNKTLLTALVQKGEDDTEFNRHRFEYLDEARNVAGNYRGFAPSSDWSIGNDGIGIGLLGEGTASALGGSESVSAGGHFYVGVGSFDGNLGSKVNTGGTKVGFNRSRSETLITLADMNGDGLPDKVFKAGDGLAYRPNLSGPTGTPSFGPPVSLPTLPAIGQERVTSTTVGGESYFGTPVLGSVNRATTEGDTYFSDVNGDGLTDLVTGGQVLFGFVNAAGVPTFSANSADTPVPVGGGAILTEGLLEDAAAIEAERADDFPLLDTLRRWVAPYDGTISINAPVQLIEDVGADPVLADGADGVRVAIQLEGTELWSQTIAADDFTVHQPAGVDSVPVSRGDRLYFRVQSVFNGALDQVAWDPEITYAGVDTSRTDVNGLPEFIYRASQDFTLFGRRATVIAPLTGTLHLDGTFEKTGVTTDDVTLLITQNGAEVFRRTLGFAEIATVSLSQDLLVNELDELEWRLLVDSPIDASKVSLAPTAHYTDAEGVDSVTDEEGNFILTVDPPVDLELYPVNALTAPQGFHTIPSSLTPPLPPLAVQARVQLSGLADGEVAEAVFTVKRRGALLAKQPIRVTGGSADDPDEPDEGIVTAEVAIEPGDELFFDVTSRDPFLPSKVTLLEARVGNDSDGDGLLDTIVPAALHTPAADELFPQPYRGWGAAGYNGNPPRDALPIDQSLLVYTEDTDADNARAYAFSPRPAEALWGGVDELAWVKAGSASSSRLGLDDIRVVRSEQFAGASAPPRISRSTNTSASIGISGSQGSSESLLEFQDLNGDRFPDVISSNAGVQYSRAVGGLESQRRASIGTARESSNETVGASTDGAGSIAVAIGDMRAGISPFGVRPSQSAKQGLDMPSFSANIGAGSSDTEFDLIDINGDGLLDKVFRDGSAALNFGYRFAPAEPWGGGIVNDGQSVDAGGGVTLGFNRDFYSLAGGLSLTVGLSRSDETYVDVNGDGLPDKVIAGNPLTVRLNKGSEFTGPIAWPGGHGRVAADKHISLGGGVYFTFGIPLVPPTPPSKIVFNSGVNASTNMGRPEVAFRDVDGDGFADHVFSERDSQLRVALNPIGRTNLLKKVYRPLGATIELDYERSGNTPEQPQSRWVLRQALVFDGHPGEGADTQLTTYRYEDGFFDRLEREFYGYARVIEEHRDTLNANALYRTITREFLNDSFYTKGLMKRELVQDDVGAPFTETEHTYVLRNVDTGVAPVAGTSTTATIFPQLTRTDRRFYEGEPSPGKVTFTTHEYDDFGNVIRFTDAGDPGAADDIDATIGYSTSCETTSYVIQPDAITVLGGGVELRRREADIDCATGNVTQVREFLADGVATTDLAYFPDGNLQTVTRPANAAGQRYTLDYEYDPVVATHVAKITDSFGLTSTATYNLKHGKVETTTDTNGNQETYLCDAFGRVDHIISPYEQGESVPTLDFEYAPVQTAGLDAEGNLVPLTQVPWALTRHVDKDADGAYKASGTIDTILFTDGLKRVLQTKKDATVLEAGATQPQDKMIVSGHVRFDAFGRTIEQRYPVTEPKGDNLTYNPAVDAVAPTVMAFDVLDRNTRTTIPDGTFTTIAYGFGPDRAGTTQFETIVADANGIEKRTYRNVRELITAVREFNQTQTLWTSYDYDALNQITRVTDDRGNVTDIAYDNLGRRTVIDNPDTGLTTFAYDLAGNLIEKVTANLRADGQAIQYDYDFNRLVAVRYPVFTDNNISYTYGAPGAPNNAAGRITKVVSRTTTNSNGETVEDSEERHYGKLGEVVFEKKTVVTFTDPNHPSVFETRYQFDPFGRLQRLIYPDGEVLTHTYDSGGNLKTAKGEKNGFRYDYLKALFYDKFEQRVLMRQGNGVETAYAYDPETRRLATLTAGRANGNLFQNLQYTYDNVGNVLGLANQVDLPPASSYGGPTSQSFGYDDLYRLTSAQGSFQFAPDKSHEYTLTLAYDTIHNIQAKSQSHHIIQPSGVAVPQKRTTYDWSYQYNPSGSGSVRPHAPVHIGERSFSYDLNGNQLGWEHDQNGTRRTIVWNEENRIESISDQGHTKTYKYDDQGERTIKRGPQGETVYVNQFFTQRPGATGTKHVFAGTTRIVSKLLRQDTPGANPEGNTPFEKDLYFYHPDHLGSSHFITDTRGKLYEHLEYFPFGESWVEENRNTQRTPYLFTAKELDEETGLYYFGARYYDPRTSVWQSGDPVLAKYLPSGDPLRDQSLPGIGGIYNPANLGLYSYSHGNPVRYLDPDGKVVETPWDIFNVAFGAGSATLNVATGNYVGAAIDVLGIAYDVTATAIPGLPAGASASIGVVRFVRAGRALAGTAQKLGRAFEGSQQVGRLAKRVENIVSKHLKPDDIAGAVKDILGKPVVKDGRTYQHLKEVTQGLRGLKNSANEIKALLGKEGLSGPQREALEETLSGVSKHIDRVEKILDTARKLAE